MRNSTYFFARYISYLFVPPSFTFLIFLFLGLVYPSDPVTSIVIVIKGFVIGLALPVIFFMILMRRGKVGDADASIKEERNIPYIFGIFSTMLGILVSTIFNLENLIIHIWVVYLAAMISLLIINKFWKISAHSMGASIPFGLLLYMYGLLGLVYLPLILVIGWSRIYLKKHDLRQVLAGAILGLFISYSILYLLNNNMG